MSSTSLVVLSNFSFSIFVHFTQTGIIKARRHISGLRGFDWISPCGPCTDRPGCYLCLLTRIFWAGPLQCCRCLESDSKPSKHTRRQLIIRWCCSSFWCVDNIISVGCLHWWCNWCDSSASNMIFQRFHESYMCFNSFECFQTSSH